jgi:hypothetical protein
VRLALEGLPRMQLPSGLFCLERRRGDPGTHGRSVRYTLMTYLGLATAAKGGREVAIDLERVETVALREVDSPEVAPGDLGLYAWVAARGSRQGEEEILERIRSALAADALDDRDGMEIAWIVLGVAALEGPEPLVADALDKLLRNVAPSGLLYHRLLGRRRRFPNFATQIYGLLALSTAARVGLDTRARAAATTLADRLLALQLPDGGWPWLFDADRGTIVERYEVYSVHQHGMAPMGLLHFAETADDERYADAARRGVEWLFGRNDLQLDMVDAPEGMIYRSIRRARPFDRLALYANTAASIAIGRAPVSGRLRLELNDTCRPYELGWLLEAWAGR